MIPSFLPECSDCHIPLEGVGFPLPKKGKGRCPNGGLYSFEVETDETKTVKDKFGNPQKVIGWKVSKD